MVGLFTDVWPGFTPALHRTTNACGTVLYDATQRGERDVLADMIGAELLAAGETVAVAEATTGGLVGAALQGVPRASRFFNGSMTIYSGVAARQVPCLWLLSFK